MDKLKLFPIILLNLAGFLLFFSWYLPTNHGLWYQLDCAVFFYFNHLLFESHSFAVFVAITNIRGFDVVSLMAMGLLYYSYWRRRDAKGQRDMLAIGLTMLITAVVVNNIGHLIPVSHPSPSRFFTDVYHAGTLTGIKTKDGSGDSFPGDHGMMLIIFSCFMWRYLGLRAFFYSLLISLIFSLPRLMAGAHWLSDILVGSLSVSMVALSWWLLTPASDKLINWITTKLPWPKA